MKKIKRILDSFGGKSTFIVGVCLLLILSIIGVIISPNFSYIGFGFLFVYVLYALVNAYVVSKNSKTAQSKNLIQLLNERYFIDSDQPVIIFDEDNEIIMFNSAFDKYSGVHAIQYGQSVELATAGNISYSVVKNNINEDGKCHQKVDVFDHSFDVEALIVESDSKSYCITIWNDITELLRLEKYCVESNPLIGFIVVDNSTEINQNAQDNYRSASAKVSVVLGEWAERFNAIIKEYERDKYILFFNEKYLEDLIASKFDILDNIRNTTEDELGVPLTLSIGVCHTSGSLDKKERVATQALDLALQRGGDQAVVKSDEETYFFGGKTKTMQKFTKIRSRIIANNLISLIDASENVIIMGHKYADFDSIGACIGVSRLVKSRNKKVNIIVNINDQNLKSVFAKLDDEEYGDMFVDAITGQDLLCSSTLVVIVDVNNKNLFEAPDVFQNANNVAIIDHHRKTEDFSREIAISYIEPSASSASELVCEILEQVLPSNTLPKVESELLLSGIILDTKNFTGNSGVRTFGAAGYLRGEGAVPTDAQQIFKEDYDDYIKQTRIMSTAYRFNEDIVIAFNETVSDEKEKILAAKAADALLNVNGILASFVLCTVDNIVHISARSTGKVNVQLILERIGGGGRYDVAGAQLPNVDIFYAKNLLEKAIEDYLREI